MTEASDEVLQRIQKLLQLAEKNNSEHEAASALAKAQAEMEKYNLTYEAAVGANVGSGARERVAVDAGFYAYEQHLWHHVAHLNFCLYWHSAKRNSNRVKNAKGHRSKYLYSHCLVGRKVNVAAARAMASYLLSAANRLTRERISGWNDTMKFDNWGNSFRQGIVDRICARLLEQRSASLGAEKMREDAARRSASGASTSTAVTLTTFIDEETDANLDFIYGEGYSAKKAAERAETARINASRERGYNRWAAANPEEAAVREKASRPRTRQSSGRASKLDAGGYWSGYDAGDSVSIHQQVDDPGPTGAISG